MPRSAGSTSRTRTANRIFRRDIRQALENFLRFEHRYWFYEISNQAQARELYAMTRQHLGLDALYRDIREELHDMGNFLDVEAMRRQNETVVRLTVVTTFGLIGTVCTGFLGMNLLAWAEHPTELRVLAFLVVLVVTTALTIYTVMKSRRSVRAARCPLRRSSELARQGQGAPGRLAQALSAGLPPLPIMKKNAGEGNTHSPGRAGLLRLDLDRHRLGAVAVLEGRRLDLLELDLARHHLGLPGLVRRVVAVEFRHHLAAEQLERLADVLVRVLAGLVEQDHLVDVGGLELGELLADGVGRADQAAAQRRFLGVGVGALPGVVLVPHVDGAGRRALAVAEAP